VIFAPVISRGPVDPGIGHKLLQDVASTVGGDFAKGVLGAVLRLPQILIDQTVDFPFPGAGSLGV
jgi:hypothetical protein